MRPTDGQWWVQPATWHRDFTVLSALFVMLFWPVLLVAGPLGVGVLGVVLVTVRNVRSALRLAARRRAAAGHVPSSASAGGSSGKLSGVP